MNSSQRESEIWTRDREGAPRLQGSQCMKCDQLFFPAKEVCPYCMTQGMSKEALIGQRGKLISVTTCYTAPKGIQAPYSFGTVEIEGGVHVLAQISGEPIGKGSQVELVVYSYPSEDPSGESFAWKYQVTEGGNK